MGFRFRRSFKILPGVRLNLSKSGVSTSVGVRGAHVTFGPKGTRTTVGIPGTGMSWTETSSAHRPRGTHEDNRPSAPKFEMPAHVEPIAPLDRASKLRAARVVPAGRSREALYKALRRDADPRFETIARVLTALGVKLTAQVVA